MKVIGQAVTKEEAKLIEEMVKQCVRHLRKAEYELDIPVNAITRATNALRVRRTPQQRSSWGGKDYISINLARWQRPETVHTEYKAYNDDWHIGAIRCCYDRHHWLIIVAHEVAHFVQYTYAPRIKRFTRRSSKPYDKPHGECFKDIYRYLRRDLVNPIIDADVDAYDKATDIRNVA